MMKYYFLVLIIILSIAATQINCDEEPFFCFIPGTVIQTPNGEIPIENLKAGDSVISWNIEQNRAVIRRIAEIHVHAPSFSRVYNIDGNNFSLQGVTGNHLIYSPGFHDYMKADQLNEKQSDISYKMQNELLAKQVRNINSSLIRTSLYDISIEGPEQNYFADGLLVHNKTVIQPPCADCNEVVTEPLQIDSKGIININNLFNCNISEDKLNAFTSKIRELVPGMADEFFDGDFTNNFVSKEWICNTKILSTNISSIINSCLFDEILLKIRSCVIPYLSDKNIQNDLIEIFNDLLDVGGRELIVSTIYEAFNLLTEEELSCIGTWIQYFLDYLSCDIFKADDDKWILNQLDNIFFPNGKTVEEFAQEIIDNTFLQATIAVPEDLEEAIDSIKGSVEYFSRTTILPIAYKCNGFQLVNLMINANIDGIPSQDQISGAVEEIIEYIESYFIPSVVHAFTSFISYFPSELEYSVAYRIFPSRFRQDMSEHFPDIDCVVEECHG